MNYRIAVIEGDGIGPEIVRESIKVIDKVGEKFSHNFSYKKYLAGGAAIDASGKCLPEDTLKGCRESDSLLLGAVGGPKWDNLSGDERPERALLGLRKELGLFANLRPALLFDDLAEACPLKKEIVKDGLDILIVRELTGGIYFGKKGYRETEMGLAAYDVEEYSEEEIKRISILAFEMAGKRRGKLTSVDKANVLESSRLWRKTVNGLAKSYPDINLEHMYVDNGAMQLIRDPKQFDVILTSNIFGDILSDEASQLTGSIGMLPSASLGRGNFGMYEPVHGSAPEIAGKNIANPFATILSFAMMLEYSFGLREESKAVEEAVKKVLKGAYRTQDIMSPGMKLIGTKEAGDLVVAALD